MRIMFKMNLKGIEKHNLSEIKNLNQRGGRMLSIMDLLKSNSLNLEMASFLITKILKNSSFIIGGNPNGVGKTTVLGALLNLTRPSIKIKSLENIPKPDEKIMYLAHEIEDGPYYSYLWGQKAKEFFSLAGKSRVATCMHADTLKEMKEVLINKVNVGEKDFKNLDLIIFLRMKGQIRRISHIYEKQGDEHKLVYEWDERKDNFGKVNKPNIKNKEIVEKIKFLKKLYDDNTVEIEEVRRGLLNFFG